MRSAPTLSSMSSNVPGIANRCSIPQQSIRLSLNAIQHSSGPSYRNDLHLRPLVRRRRDSNTRASTTHLLRSTSWDDVSVWVSGLMVAMISSSVEDRCQGQRYIRRRRPSPPAACQYLERFPGA